MSYLGFLRLRILLSIHVKEYRIEIGRHLPTKNLHLLYGGIPKIINSLPCRHPQTKLLPPCISIHQKF